MNTPEVMKSVAAKWFEGVWNHPGRLDLEASIMAYAHPDTIASLEGIEEDVTLTEWRDYRQALLTAFPDFHVTVDSLLAEGDRCHVQWHVTGTHDGPGLGIPPTGRPVRFSGVTILDFRDGKICGGNDNWNRGELIASLTRISAEEVRASTGLTARETEVALLMAERHSHAEIATRLGISTSTARRHCERVLGKLGLHSRRDVAEALRAFKHGKRT